MQYFLSEDMFNVPRNIELIISSKSVNSSYFCSMSDERTELKDLGEFGLIEHLTNGINLCQASTVLGIGDDAAAVDANGQLVLLSTDMLCEGVHFNLMYAPLKHLGYKAIVSNLSDIYAMNGTPTQVVVSLALSNRFSVEAVNELYSGMRLACELYEVDLVGGDTTSSMSGLIINVAVTGLVNEADMVKRSGAKKGDLLVVSGDLGSAYMGLQILEREKEVFQAAPTAQPQFEGFDYMLQRQLKPEARKDVIELLAQLEVKPSAMIDVSDGLASEALHIAKQSKLSVKIYEDKLPIDPKTVETAQEFKLDGTTIALSGGEDYELLFTMSQNDYDKIKGNPSLSVIGYMDEEGGDNALITRSGQAVELTAQGWNHLNKE